MNAECGKKTERRQQNTDIRQKSMFCILCSVICVLFFNLRTPNSKLRTQLGFTLIELIIFIVLAGVILPLIFIPFMTGLKDYKTPELVSTATFLAQELMEEIKSKSFEDPNDTPAFGPEAGENRSTYDDIDDYNGLTETPSVFTGYSRTVTVFYVDPAGNLDTNAGAITTLKRILVTVTNAQIPDVAMATLVSNH